MKCHFRKVWLLIIAIVVTFSGCISEANNQEVTNSDILVLRFGHYAAADHPANQAAILFAEKVKERTEGKIIIEIFSDGQLGTPPEVLEQNIIGSIDMNLPTQGGLDKYSKKFATVMLPFVFDDYEHAHRVLDGEFVDWVKDDLDKQGLVMLSNWEYGFRNITNNILPIINPEDLVGLRLRTPPEMQLQLAMESLGANVTKIAYPEIYLSLQQGVVDGQENPLSVIYYNKLYEVQKYLAMTRHTYNSMVHVISKKTWDKLTKEQQKIIREESINAGLWMREEVQRQEIEILKELEKQGMIITYPDRNIFKSKMQYAYDGIANYAGSENIEYFLKLVEEGR